MITLQEWVVSAGKGVCVCVCVCVCSSQYVCIQQICDSTWCQAGWGDIHSLVYECVCVCGGVFPTLSLICLISMVGCNSFLTKSTITIQWHQINYHILHHWESTLKLYNILKIVLNDDYSFYIIFSVCEGTKYIYICIYIYIYIYTTYRLLGLMCIIERKGVKLTKGQTEMKTISTKEVNFKSPHSTVQNDSNPQSMPQTVLDIRKVR